MLKTFTQIAVISALCTLLPLPADAANNYDDYWGSHAQGWHWYQQTQQRPSADSSPNQAANSDPVQQMAAWQEDVKQALDKAILNPTTANVLAYMQLQNQLSQQASHFSAIWQQLLWSHPSLDYSFAHPTNQLGRQAYWDKQHMRLQKTAKALAKDYGLFFIFKGRCPYCQRFAPILQAFSQRYGFYVLPVTLDGQMLPEYPLAKADNGIAAHLRITQVPAVVAVSFNDIAVKPIVNPIIKPLIKPIAYGLLSEDDLLEHLIAVLKPSILSNAHE